MVRAPLLPAVLIVAVVLAGCDLVGGSAFPGIPAIVPEQAIRIAQASSESLGPTRVLEVRQGTWGELHRGPGLTVRGGGMVEDIERRMARPSFLVVLVGTFKGNCEQGCAPEEGREEIIVDMASGEVTFHSSQLAPGGIVPVPRDHPCPGGVECAPIDEPSPRP